MKARVGVYLRACVRVYVSLWFYAYVCRREKGRGEEGEIERDRENRERNDTNRALQNWQNSSIKPEETADNYISGTGTQGVQWLMRATWIWVALAGRGNVAGESSFEQGTYFNRVNPLPNETQRPRVPEGQAGYCSLLNSAARTGILRPIVLYNISISFYIFFICCVL